MATETDPQMTDGVSEESATFEDIDWDDIDKEVNAKTKQQLAWYLAGGAWLLGVLVDIYFRLAEGVYRAVVSTATGTESFDVELPAFVPSSGPYEFPVVGTIEALTWLWLLTLLVGVFYVAVPLYRNKRMTAYYWQEFRKNKAAVISLIYLSVIFLIGLVAPRFLDRPEVEPLAQYQPPVYGTVGNFVPIQCKGEVTDGTCHGTWAHPLGTTSEGKDILTSVIFGMEISMQVGLIATMISLFIATTVALTGVYFGGYIDEALFRWVDIQITFPTFFLYLLVIYLFGGSLFLLIVVFGIFGWGGFARIVRSEALQRNEEEFVDAAQNAGAGAIWTMRRHLLPNVTNSLVTAASLSIPGLILAEAALAFLGLGDPRIPSWGQLISAGQGELDRAWWISTLPGVFLFFTILAFNFMGDAIRDAIDPRNTGGES